MTLLWCTAVVAQADEKAGSETAGYSHAQVQAATATVGADPAWGQSRKEKHLRFKPSEKEPNKPDKPQSSDVPWLLNFLEWVANASRVFVWVVGGLALAFLLVGLRHWVRVRGEAVALQNATLPSHVSRLDIRPQSLPRHVGDVAAALWQKGEHRQALSLLYRGVLSSLVHQHGVAIATASTEDECVALALARVSSLPGIYVQGMVDAWKLAVYGGKLPESAHVMEMCSDFEQYFAQDPTTQRTPLTKGPV